MTECAICGRATDQLYTCSECGGQVCNLCYVEAVDMCTDCEETWEAEEDLDVYRSYKTSRSFSKRFFNGL